MRTAGLIVAWVGLCISIAQADVCVVRRVEGRRVTVTAGLMAVRVGERVGLTVVPGRSYGVGEGVVTDFDLRTHEVGILILGRRSRADARADRRRPPRARRIGKEPAQLAFRLEEPDVVEITEQHRYGYVTGGFRLSHPEGVTHPQYRDIPLFMMPPLEGGASSAGATQASGAPRPSAGGPDLEAILRALQPAPDSGSQRASAPPGKSS